MGLWWFSMITCVCLWLTYKRIWIWSWWSGLERNMVEEYCKQSWFLKFTKINKIFLLKVNVFIALLKMTNLLFPTFVNKILARINHGLMMVYHDNLGCLWRPYKVYRSEEKAYNFTANGIQKRWSGSWEEYDIYFLRHLWSFLLSPNN